VKKINKKTEIADLSLVARDLACLWHPYTQHKTAAPPIAIVKGCGAILYDEQKKAYIDAIASWWQNLHGHSHPYLAKAIYKQAKQLEHVIFANFTHAPAVELAERILNYMPANINRIFYTDNGSTSVEVGIKIAIQYFYNQNIIKKRFVAFKNSYHGDTFAAMSVASPSIFNLPFGEFLFQVEFIDAPILGKEGESVQQFAQIIQKYDDIAGFIFEPLVQGAAGMQMHSAAGLDRLVAMAKNAQIICIADEIMTAFYRTGKFLATDYLENKPDIICLSKGLTSGMLPLGITACANFLYEGFLSDERAKAFFHGHSCTANPLSTRLAAASLDLLEKKSCRQKIVKIAQAQQQFITKISRLENVQNARALGVIAAFEWKMPTKADNQIINWAAKIYQFFIRRGVILRPLGNTIYILPPYCIRKRELEKVYKTIIKFLTKTRLDNSEKSGDLYF